MSASRTRSRSGIGSPASPSRASSHRRLVSCSPRSTPSCCRYSSRLAPPPERRSTTVLDTVIRGGTIVDGTGADAFTGDVGVRDGHIVAVGKVSEAAREEIDADGALVTPGFLDLH